MSVVAAWEQKMRVLSSVVMLAVIAGFSAPARADLKICVVDAEQAINETVEGKAAQTRLESMYATKQAEIEKKGKDLEREFQDYEARQMILSEDARRTTEATLLQKRQDFQAMVYQAEQEMQSTYMSLLSGMEEKLMTVAQSLGASKGCTVVLQKAAVVYVGSGVTDLTTDLVRAYDAKN
ncbi:MAG TPA: OmpH family outer membrane protein [Myxococcota bacterium]|nr:OmpH family outer membrane protein [Myxococcota bacterium]